MRRTEHHIWCNFFGRDASDCPMCARLERDYPADGMTGEEMMAEYFPGNVLRAEERLRDYRRFDGYVNRLSQDVYAQPADEGHRLWGLQAIHTLFSIPQGCHNVLDIGCGQGQFRTAMEAIGLAWTGVVLGEDYAIAVAAGLNVKHADMTFLPFEDVSFDLIFARHVLEHSPFPVVTLMEWRRVCRGWMALILPAPDYWKARGRNHYSVLPRDNWLWLLERSGWHPLHEHTMTTDDEVFLRAWKSELPPEEHVDVEYRFLCERIPEATE